MTDTAPVPSETERAAARQQSELSLLRSHTGILGAQNGRLKAERDQVRDRLGRIAESHSKNVDEAGGSWGDCTECGWIWPCPTYAWATEDRDALAPWNPMDDEVTTDG